MSRGSKQSTMKTIETMDSNNYFTNTFQSYIVFLFSFFIYFVIVFV